MIPTLLPLLLAGTPQHTDAPPPRVAVVAMARARIVPAARVSLNSFAPPTSEAPRERRIVRDDGRVEIQFE